MSGLLLNLMKGIIVKKKKTNMNRDNLSALDIHINSDGERH